MTTTGRLAESVGRAVAVVRDPLAQLGRLADAGHRLVGCAPMLAPVELADAAGLTPFGIWGFRTELSRAKAYFPAFLDSVVQTTLELGLRGELDALEALIVPHVTDSLKCLGQNWQAGVPAVPMIPLVPPHNRQSAGAAPYLRSVYGSVLERLEGLGNGPVPPGALEQAIWDRQEQRVLLRQFAAAAGRQAELITPLERSAVMTSRLYMPAGEHITMLRQILDTLGAAPKDVSRRPGVVLSGLMAPYPELSAILEAAGMAVAGDELAQESVSLRLDVATGSGDPLGALVDGFLALDGVPALHDPSKHRIDNLLDVAERGQAKGVIFVQTQFWEPDEFDRPLLVKALDEAGLPSVLVEVDLSMANFERARSIVDAFAEIL
ncbi:MAG: 2-hydroxyacyl-CoA dehydratase family protein [Bifidobacteriaceae bacterium]|jgi:benzoyl-CoA reductase/2-hydroxyglutaryl-CoA dehydratase subunit BcrC/BadD/HgdB|nr:2-hydroxyacyl-CoA dehydratase family protein [Bifidobacteriaceae bacterium]